MVTSDLIQENSVDRFEKKNRKPRPNNNNRDKNNPRQPDNRPARPQSENKNPRQADNRNRPNEQKPFKKPKKKFPPKNEGNA